MLNIQRARRSAIAVATLVVALAAGPAASAAQSPGRYKVIVHPASQLSSVTKKELTAVYMKKTTKWSDGTPAMPVDLVESAEVRDRFSREVLGKPTTVVRAYWNQMIFSGRNVPPSEKVTDAAVLEYVRRTPGAVGYVSAGAPTPGVKVVTVGS